MLFLVEIIGTIAFSISGAVIAMEKKMDLLGVLVLGSVTAIGGGIMRDVFIGSLPPASFRHPIYLILAMLTAALMFLLVRVYPAMMEARNLEQFEKIVNIFDAVGLGAFTAIGMEVTLGNVERRYWIYILFLGSLTGVGGGIIRDVLAGQAPVVFCKRIYALASLAGAVSYLVLIARLPENVAVTVCVMVVVIIRLCAAHFRWDLPIATKN